MDVVAMPQLGETVTEGTITGWSKQVGDEIAVDDALFEVSTEKVDTEVPSAVSGFLRAILVEEGQTVPVGVAVAVITATADEAVDLAGLAGPVGSEPAPVAAPGPAVEAPEPADGPAAVRPRAAPADDGSTPPPGFLSPVVQRLLGEHGLRADDVTGSGRNGRITRADVLAAAARAVQRPAGPGGGPGAVPVPIADDDEVVDFSRARSATAEHMVRSVATAAHALVATQVDYANLDPVRQSAGLSFLPFVARAVIDAIGEFPHVNASVDVDGGGALRLVVHRRVHLGVAVDVNQEALVVPVVRHADQLRLASLSSSIADVADRARRRRLPGDAFDGGTFTLTNVGSFGTLLSIPIINQPQVAILSTDGVRMAPVAVRIDHGGTGEKAWGIAVHPVGNLSLSFDHRALDGAYAAAFLARVRVLLETRDWAGELGP